MGYRLTGINPLAYVGVEPYTPPGLTVQPRSPTSTDSKNFNLGTFWLVAAPPPTNAWELWILVDLTAGIATWIKLFPGSGVVAASEFFEDIGFAVPNGLGQINVLGGENINTFGDNVQTITINLNHTIHWPDTSNDGLNGIIYLGGAGGMGGFTFMHNYGLLNTFLGQTAGNLTLDVATSAENTGIGYNALNGLTIGAAFNCALGASSLSDLTIGASNCALGSGALQLLISGSNNTCVGTDAGSNYTGAESGNIIIGSDGLLGESLTIRIGDNGIQNAAYIGGVYGKSVGATNQTVIIDNTGKLGSMTNAIPGGVIITTFDMSGVWTKNINTKIVEFYVWNGGCGGGSGRQGATGAASGGGGGTAGNFRYLRVLASFCGAAEAITVGTGGAGGASQAAINTNGNDGALGTASGVGMLLMTTFPYNRFQGPPLNHNLYGLGGGNVSGAGGALNTVMDGTSRVTWSSQGGLGSYSIGSNALDYGWFSQAQVPPPGVAPQALSYTNYAGGSGGGGGGGDVAVGRSGGNGSDFVDIDDSVTLIAGALGGTFDTDGNLGIIQPITGAIMIGGGGGGGGGGMMVVRAGNGGNGNFPGGGGGGGGGSINGTPSGAGGNGGNGRVVVVEYL